MANLFLQGWHTQTDVFVAQQLAQKAYGKTHGLSALSKFQLAAGALVKYRVFHMAWLRCLLLLSLVVVAADGDEFCCVGIVQQLHDAVHSLRNGVTAANARTRTEVFEPNAFACERIHATATTDGGCNVTWDLDATFGAQNALVTSRCFHVHSGSW